MAAFLSSLSVLPVYRLLPARTIFFIFLKTAYRIFIFQFIPHRPLCQIKARMLPVADPTEKIILSQVVPLCVPTAVNQHNMRQGRISKFMKVQDLSPSCILSFHKNSITNFTAFVSLKCFLSFPGRVRLYRANKKGACSQFINSCVCRIQLSNSRVLLDFAICLSSLLFYFFLL